MHQKEDAKNPWPASLLNQIEKRGLRWSECEVPADVRGWQFQSLPLSQKAPWLSRVPTIISCFVCDDKFHVLLVMADYDRTNLKGGIGYVFEVAPRSCFGRSQHVDRLHEVQHEANLAAMPDAECENICAQLPAYLPHFAHIFVCMLCVFPNVWRIAMY